MALVSFCRPHFGGETGGINALDGFLRLCSRAETAARELAAFMRWTHTRSAFFFFLSAENRRITCVMRYEKYSKC